MAKIAFISLYDESAYGIRLLSACLKKAGHQRNIIFLKGYKSGKTRSRAKLCADEKPWEGINHFGNPFVYAISNDITEKEKEILIKLIKDIAPDLIGVSVNTPLKYRAIIISKLIKAALPNTMLIWGGFEATINPSECLNYCDVVCRGEAEQTIVELANVIDKKGVFKNINNLCFKENEKTIENELNIPCKNLDDLPFQDVMLEGNYFIDSNKLLKNPNLLFPSPNLYSTITARGCPFQCTYCCEEYMKNLYKPHAFLRRRSPMNVIAELEETKAKNNINYIIFQDEIFSYQKEWLEEFLPLYKDKIRLPFTAYIFPSKNLKERLKLLKEAGLSSTSVSIQSGSPRIAKFYNRYYNKELFLEAATTIRAMNIDFYTDVITYNPLEKEQDLKETLKFLLELPQPYDICINKLYTLPETKLFNQLQNIVIDRRMGYIFDYYSRLFWIASYFRSSRIIVAILDKFSLFKRTPFLLTPILYVCFYLGSLNKIIYKINKLKTSNRLNFNYIINFAKRKLKI